jgi:hypothetical protein
MWLKGALSKFLSVHIMCSLCHNYWGTCLLESSKMCLVLVWYTAFMKLFFGIFKRTAWLCAMFWYEDNTWWIIRTWLLKMYVLWNSKVHCVISACFKYRISLLLCSWAWQLYCIESLHLLGHPVTGGVLWDMIKETVCSCLN